MALELALSGFGWAVGKSLLANLVSEVPLLDELAPELVDWFREQKAQTPTSEQEQLLQLAQNITNRFKADLKATLPEHELLALLYEFDQTFKTFEIKHLFELQLDSAKLVKRLLSARPKASLHLSPKARFLYQQLITSTAQELVLLSSALPTFHSLRDASLLQILPALNALIEGPQQEIREFEEDYLNQVCAELNKLELFGVPRLNNIMEQQKLKTAYVNLEVEYSKQTYVVQSSIFSEGTSEISGYRQVIESITQVLIMQRRIIVRGSAGSGKTTLLRWLAIQMASRELPPQLAYWNTLIPFYIRLRSIDEQSGFPTLDQYVAQIDPDLVHRQPQQWVHQQMETGRAVLLIDGLDELAKDRRAKFLERLQRLVRTYPLVSYVISSRPAATREDNWPAWYKWSKNADFFEVNITKMNAQAIELFIDHWHHAYAEGSTVKSAKDLQQAARALKRLLPNRSAIHSLAENPLLCSMICALHLERRQNLPNRRLQLYKECIDMMLERDNGREINTDSRLDVEQKRDLLQSLAWIMLMNNQTWYEVRKVENFFRKELPKYYKEPKIAEIECKNLVERSGLLQEPTEDTIEFTHRTFQEYLAAKEIVEREYDGYLLKQVENEQLRDLFPLAIGQMRPREAEDFLNNLIVEQAPLSQKLLALSSLETTIKISPELRERIFNAVGELFPPYRQEHQRILASVGEVVIPYLLCEHQPNIAAMTACIKVLAQIGGENALNAIETYACFEDEIVQAAISHAWPYFDAELFAIKFLQQHLQITVSEPHLLPYLQYLPNLKQLDLSGSNIHDFNVLSGLRNLQQLVLSGTQISNLSALIELKNLQKLDLSRTKVRDLAVLSGLSNLQQLSLENVQARDLAVLSGLGNLQQLSLKNVQAKDLEVLSGLNNLQQLSLENVSLRDLSALSGLDNLQELTLINVPARDLSALSRLSNLQQLRLDNVPARNLGVLSRLSNLQQLMVMNVQTINLGVLSGLSNLQQLTLIGTQAINLGVLSKLSNLQQLSLSDIQGIDLGVLSELSNLQTLGLNNVQGIDLGMLSGLSNLQQLNLNNVQGIDLGMLSGLSNLQHLSLVGLIANDLKALNTLHNLIGLILIGVQVQNISSLKQLPKLRSLILI